MAILMSKDLELPMIWGTPLACRRFTCGRVMPFRGRCVSIAVKVAAAVGECHVIRRSKTKPGNSYPALCG